MGRHKKIKTPEELEQFEIILKLPESVRDGELIQAAGYGLWLVLIGERPKRMPSGKLVSTRIKLSPKGKRNWEKALEIKGFNSQRHVMRSALALVQELPVHARKTKI